MLLACLPFGPLVTSKETFWPSFSVREALTLDRGEVREEILAAVIGLMKPKPFASLNHLTVPVAMTSVLETVKRSSCITGRDRPARCSNLKVGGTARDGGGAR